jgi:hypothetical protein
MHSPKGMPNTANRKRPSPGLAVASGTTEGTPVGE